MRGDKNVRYYCHTNLTSRCNHQGPIRCTATSVYCRSPLCLTHYFGTKAEITLEYVLSNFEKVSSVTALSFFSIFYLLLPKYINWISHTKNGRAMKNCILSPPLRTITDRNNNTRNEDITVVRRGKYRKSHFSVAQCF